MTSATIGQQPCPHCGAYWHSGMCPRIAEIEYHPNGTVARIKYRDDPPTAAPTSTFDLLDDSGCKVGEVKG